MKHWIFKTLTIVLLGIFVLGGCSQDSGTTIDDSESLNLVEEFGGYQPTSEQPGFGDPEITENYSEPEAAGKDLNNIPELSSIQSDSNVLVYSFRILWGILDYDSTITTPTDWSGSLTVDTGCIKVINKILFETGDHFVRPRPNARTLEWISYTQPHYDGILVFMYFRPGDDVMNTEVKFETGPYSRTFTLFELDSLDEVIDVAELGNKISFGARKLERLECPEGFLEGRWVKRGILGPGLFYGRFVSFDGLFLGHVKGHWGRRIEDGVQIFFGKWINHYGQFRGFLKGKWGYNTSEEPESEGWFEGHYYGADGIERGDLAGDWIYRERPSADNQGSGDNDGNEIENGNSLRMPKNAKGFFRGLWREHCE